MLRFGHGRASAGTVDSYRPCCASAMDASASASSSVVSLVLCPRTAMLGADYAAPPPDGYAAPRGEACCASGRGMLRLGVGYGRALASCDSAMHAPPSGRERRHGYIERRHGTRHGPTSHGYIEALPAHRRPTGPAPSARNQRGRAAPASPRGWSKAVRGAAVRPDSTLPGVSKWSRGGHEAVTRQPRGRAADQHAYEVVDVLGGVVGCVAPRAVAVHRVARLQRQRPVHRQRRVPVPANIK
jgi:hypothetical protein